MRSLIIIGILLIMTSATHVSVANQCVCDKLLSQADCKVKIGCSWSSTTNLCNANSETTTTESYCGLITDAATCAKTKGCAYLDSACVIFAGCTAYKGVTDAECQAISKFCNSDGVAFCVAPGTCSSYKTEETCAGKASNAGSGTCVWDSGCRDQKCTEADSSLITTAQCNNFIKGCVSNGKGCVTSLGVCSTYTGDVDSCQGLIGSDGYCKGVDGGTKCQAKVCTDAETSLATDAACATYQIGCVTTGYGCVNSPLGACSTLTGDDVICANKRGSDGKCKGVAEGKTCSVVACIDASDSLSTDDDCNSYKKGCVTTGKGCATSRGACSSYKGTSTTCDGYIGSDGKCKGASDAEAACSPKVCTGADASLNTDDLCNDYQTGCKTTGKGCIATLSTCSSYTGDSTTCDGYIGTDGKCKGGASSGPCSAKVCTEAATTLTTNEECANYQTGCIASGTGGCIAAGACNTLLLSTQCDGKSTCQWTPQCVKNVACTDLTSEILCKTVTLQNGNTCWWSSGACVVRVCTQAPATYDSDSLCDSFLKGCLTKKTGCLAPTATCTSYSGTKAQCEGFTLKCTNTDAATDSTACTNLTCAGNTTATSDDACNSYHKGCLTKGTGCIDPTEPCSSYAGASTDVCGKFTGNSGANKCWWTSGASCVDKACTLADATLTTDDQCKAFLTGCVTTGAGCKADTTACSSYSLTQSQCGLLSKKCAKAETCAVEVTCATISNPSNQQSCDDALPNTCMFVKDKCITIGLCNTYTNAATLSLDICKVLKDTNGNLCNWSAGTACEARTCAQVTAAGQTKDTCAAYLSTCTATPSGVGCETVTCANATTKTEVGCQAYHSTCHYHNPSNTATCLAADFCTSYTMNTLSDCLNLVTNTGVKCKAPGSANPCVEGVCADKSSTDSATCNAYKIKYTTATYLSTAAQFCVYNGTTCRVRSCTNALSDLGLSVITSLSQCSNYFELCVMSYSGASDTGNCVDGQTGAGAANMGCALLRGTTTTCKTLQGRYQVGSAYVYKYCKGTSATVAACADRACADITDGKTDAICQAYLPTCKTNGTSCVDQSVACTTFSSTAEGCANLQGVIAGSKCQQTPAASAAACTDRTCVFNGTATTDKDCDKYLTGCITTGKGCVPGTTPCTGQYGNQDGCKALTGNGKKCWSTSTTIKGACIDRTCSHNTTATTDVDCDTFLTGCVTKGTGCIESTAECSSYQGTQTDCEKFTGNGKSCTNDATATATTACKTKDCTKLTADSYSEAVCQAYGKQCHYNGTKCDVISSCASMKGNFVTCATYFASDRPCKGTALQTETPTSCSAAACTDAPITFTTDDECKQYKTGCVTNGRGCASSVNCGDVQNESSCLAVKSAGNNICTWASQCRDVQSACSSFTSSGSSVCLTSKVTSGFGICIWKNSACTESTCEDLPLTVGSEDDCRDYSDTCTFGGANQGCITKGYCTSYKTKENCTNAKSKDKIGACTWDETITSGTNIVGCRTKDCKDAVTSISDDKVCEAFISGCKTNGAGCMTSPFECSDFKTQAKCLQDSSLQPCLWYNNACSQYYKCEDLPLKTVSACQAISKYCTTEDSKCIALKTCANYTKQSQCVIGTDGSCGWVTQTKKCQLYNSCAELISKVNSECQAFNSKCISNGTNCIEIGECSSYADSETACKLGGTDGTCFFDKTSTSCRLRQCSDSTTSTSTHNGCYGYQINSSTKCTTDGSTCIALADCSTYKQAGCVIDSNFNACIYDTTSKACKQKACIDIKKTKSSDCAAAIYGCISNGTNCIAKAKCETYTTKESCNAGGLDGSCAFTPSSTSATTGTCKLFSQCSDANSDQTACQNKSAACKWTAAAGTTASSCSVHTCDTAAKGTAKCVSVPNFDASQFTICIPSGGKCISGEPSDLTQDSCYKMSQYTYSWNANTKKCVSCGGGTIVENNETKNDSNTTAETPISNTTSFGVIYSVLAIILLIIQ